MTPSPAGEEFLQTGPLSRTLPRVISLLGLPVLRSRDRAAMLIAAVIAMEDAIDYLDVQLHPDGQANQRDPCIYE